MHFITSSNNKTKQRYKMVNSMGKNENLSWPKYNNTANLKKKK